MASPATILPPAPHPANFVDGDDLFKARYELTAEEERLVGELRERLQDLLADAGTARQCKTAALVRFLRAREWQLDPAEELLRKALAWRTEFKLESISPDALDEEASSGKLYINGTDRLGRPVMYQKPRRQNTKAYELQVQQVAYTLEREVGAMDPARCVEKHVIVIDFRGYSMWNAPPMSQSKQVLSLLMDRFPERLGDAFLVDTPSLFHMAYRVLKAFMPQATKKKLHFVSSSGKHGATGKMDKAFADCFDAEQLESDFGGLLTSEYDHAAYWSKELEYHRLIQTWREDPTVAEEALQPQPKKQLKRSVSRTSAL